QLRALIARAYSMAQSGDIAESTPAALGDESLTTGDEPIVAAVNQIMTGAADIGASDIHINPDENELLLRYRVDGVLQTQQGPARSAHASIVQRLKVLAKLDLTQTRKPQDGKFRFMHRGTEPVDIRLSVILQMQVNADVGLTFATALRSVLRQDPDVVLVGEIRDQETAKIAVQAALTGHLVLSTLHTNDAVGALARLKDFSVP